MKPRNKAFWIPGDVLMIDTLVLLGDAEWAMREGKRRTGLADTIKSGCQGSVVDIQRNVTNDLLYFVLWVSGKPGTPSWTDTVTHEVSHLVDRILATHSIPPGRESTELRALIQGWYSRQICHGARGTRDKTPKQEWE